MVVPTLAGCGADSGVGGMKENYFYPNAITVEDAKRLGDLQYRTWLVHHSARMGDCVRLNYGYRIIRGRIFVWAAGLGDVDVHDEVMETSAKLHAGASRRAELTQEQGEE